MCRLSGAYRSPWQSPYVERLIGSVRRERLHHVIVLDEGHLRRILRDYLAYYHGARTHLSLGRNVPIPCAVEPLSRGRIIAIPHVGGLHHRYTRAAWPGRRLTRDQSHAKTPRQPPEHPRFGVP